MRKWVGILSLKVLKHTQLRFLTNLNGMS